MARPGLVVLSGPAGAGKTTIGVELAPRIGATLLSKDLIKEALYEPLEIRSDEASLTASRAAMRLIYTIAGASGSPVVVEANWHATDVQDLSALRRPTAQVFCTAPADVLRERANSRVTSGARHPVHRDRMSPDVLAALLADIETASATPLVLDCPTLTVETSGQVDIEIIVGWLEQHLPGMVDPRAGG